MAPGHEPFILRSLAPSRHKACMADATELEKHNKKVECGIAEGDWLAGVTVEIRSPVGCFCCFSHLPEVVPSFSSCLEVSKIASPPEQPS